MENRQIPDNFGEFITLRDQTGGAIELGSGGFGTTIRVNRPRAIGGRDFGRDYALKILHGQAIQDKKRREQFLSEIKALGALDHGNIVKYEDCGEQDGLVYLVMQLCSGGDLERFVRDFGAFSERTALQVTLQVCDGLREAHRKNYLHRDIKPRNILLVESVPPTADLQWFEEGIDEGKLCFKVVDFGLAGRLDHEVKTTGFAGSPMFCSPEQVRERELDARSDIYSLGMTLWYLVQGRGPLLRADGRPIGDSREAMSAHTSPTPHDERFPPSLAPEFRAVLSRMLRKSPDQRFNSVNELSQAIRRVLESDALPKSTGPTALRSSEPDEVPLDEQPDYGKGDPEDLYPERTEYGRRSLGKFYRAIPRNSTEAVGLTAWDSMASPDAAQERELAQKLQKLKRVTCSKDAPPSLTSIEDVHRTAGSWCIAEEWHEGVPLSELVACRGRSLSLEEIAQLLVPVAEAADFLLTNEINNAMLTLGDIRLCGPGLAPDDRSWLALPVDRWGEWRVQLSALSVPADLTSTVESSFPSSGTISGSLFIDNDSTLSIGKAFCRLFYRMGEGSEVAAAADWDEYSYTEANRLSAASNVLLRRVICGAEEAKSVGELLRKICSNEGVYRLPNSSAMTTGMKRTHMSIRTSTSVPVDDISSSVIIEPTPDSAEEAVVEEAVAEVPVEEFPEETMIDPHEHRAQEAPQVSQAAPPTSAAQERGSSLDRRSTDSIDMTQMRSERVPIVQPSIALDVEVAQIVEGGVGRVRSPYGGRREQQVSGPAWRANGQIYCAETNRPFRLPRNLPPLEAALIPDRFDAALSPYWDPPVEFAIPLGRWVAGGEVTCEQTGLPLRLPSNLPVPVGLIAPGRPGWVRSPYGEQPEIAIQPPDWNPGQKCICTASGQLFTLPATLPPLHAIPSEVPGVFTSPYAPEQRIALQPHECVAGFKCECPETGKPLIVPTTFPASWRFEGRVRQTQVPEAQSPFVPLSESQSWQPVLVEQWAPGAVMRCARTQREFVLPSVLPTLAVSPAPNAPAVFSPFPPHQPVPVAIEFWKPGAKFDLALGAGTCRVVLPEGELQPVTAVPAEIAGHFSSPYVPGQTFEVAAVDCVRGKTITCPVSGERLILPSEFPESWQWTGEVRQTKVPEVRSPFVKEDDRAWLPLSAADWTPGGKIRCRVTGREFLLPAELPVLKVTAGPTAPSILSPFPPHELVQVANADWRRNAELNVQLSSGNTCRVVLPGDILPLGRAELEDLASLPLGLDAQIRARRGAIRSPHGRKPWVEVASRDWLPGMRLVCPATRRHFWLPAELPPLEARLGPRPGSVWSPYTDQAVDIPADQWVPGDTVPCPATQGLFVLPPELPLLVGNVDEARPGFVESPFAPKDFFQLAASQWQPSAEIVCPRTRRAFCLPAHLPEFIADVELESPLGMVRSPYNERNIFRVRGEEWVAGGYVQCTATNLRARLPENLPPLCAALVEGRPGYILTPYASHPTPQKVANMAWREGGIIVCPETGRPLQLPDLLPTLPSLPLMRRPLVLAGVALAAVVAVGGVVLTMDNGGQPPPLPPTPAPVTPRFANTTPLTLPASTPTPPPSTPAATPSMVTASVAPKKNWPKSASVSNVSPLPDKIFLTADGGFLIQLGLGKDRARWVLDLSSLPASSKTASIRFVKEDYADETRELTQTFEEDMPLGSVTLSRNSGALNLTGTLPPYYTHLRASNDSVQVDAKLVVNTPIKLRPGTYSLSLVADTGRFDARLKVEPRPLREVTVSAAEKPIDVPIPPFDYPAVMAGTTTTPWVRKSEVMRTPDRPAPPGEFRNAEFQTWSPVVITFDEKFETGWLYEVNNLVSAHIVGIVDRSLTPLNGNRSIIGKNVPIFLKALALPLTQESAIDARDKILETTEAFRGQASKEGALATEKAYAAFRTLMKYTIKPSWTRLMEACLGKGSILQSDLDELTETPAGGGLGYLLKTPIRVQKCSGKGELELVITRHWMGEGYLELDGKSYVNARKDWFPNLATAPSEDKRYQWKMSAKWIDDPCDFLLRNPNVGR